MAAFAAPAVVNGSEAGAGTICTHGSDFGCIDTYKVDSQIFSTMMTSGVAGLLCLAAFCFLQTFISVYRGRLLSPQVAIKPPVYTGDGIAKYFYWIWATVSLKEKELLATAGMDALMFERLIVFGLQLMAPITILSCAVLIPVHATSGFLATSKAQLQSNLMGLTMSNIPPGSSTLWLHFAFVWAYCLYALWLLDRHYQWYVLLRQQYMTRGDSISTWLGHMPQRQPQGLRSGSVPANDSDSAMQQQLLNPASGFARCTRSEAGDVPAAGADGTPVCPADAAAAVLLGSAAVHSKGPDSIHMGQTLEKSMQQVELAARFQPEQQQAQQAMQCVSQSAFAAAMSASGSDSLLDPAATQTSSPADSRFTSRQSSLKALLPGVKVTRSSSQHLHSHTVTFTSDAGTGCMGDEVSGFAGSTVAEGPAAHTSRSTRSSATGFVGHLKRIGSFGTWKGGSGYNGLGQQQEWQRRHCQHKQHQAAVSAAAAAAGKLGADVDWWSFKTGDPLLDRHVVQVDVADDLAWDDEAEAQQLSTSAGPSAQRLHLWWELAPSGSSPLSTAAATGNAPQVTTKQGAPALQNLQSTSRSTKSGNIMAVPGTCLLFDKRSLRARKPSVRFRNTVHVQGLSGNLLPLHVSNYAVLVTGVPSGDGRYAGEDDEYVGDEVHRHRPGLLLGMLQASIWNWPCLLSQDDLTDLSASWNDQSFRARSMHFSDSMRQLIVQHQQEQEQEQQQEQLQQEGPAAPPSGQAVLGRRRGRRTSSSSGSSRQQQVSDRERLVEQTFRQLFKDDLHAVIPVRNFQAVDELLRQWNDDLQKYIQARALLQLRVEREGSRSGFRQQVQQQRPARSSLGAQGSSEGLGDYDLPITAGAPCRDSENGKLQQRQQQPSMPGLHICTDATPQQASELTAADCPTLTTQAGPDSKGRMHQSWPTADGRTVTPRAALQLPQGSAELAESFSGLEEPCKTPRLAPLKPHPVMPEKVMTRPRLVTKDEGENTTAFGKCCAAVLAILASGKADDISDAETCSDVRAIAQRLEQQRQALVDLEASILEAQKEVLSSADTGSFIVLFKTPAAATLAARSTVFPQSTNSLEAFKVQAAPSPEDMLWQNLWRSPSSKRDESLRCLFWYALLYLVPTGIFTAALNSISYSICNSQAVGPNMAWFCESHLLQFLFTVILPMVLLMLWQNAVIPANLYKLELRRGAAVSLSEMEQNILLIYVGWELVNLFLGGVLSASLTSQIKMLADNPDQWAMLLGAAFPNSSNFFLNYVITRAFMMNLFRLIMPHGGMWRWIGQMLFTGAASFSHAATERYRAFITYPASIRYGREPGLILLILLMGVAYSVAAPLITPFVLAYLCTAYLVWRYQMIYVCVRCYESGGKMWPVYFVIVLWCLGLFVVFSSCILIFKHANVQGVLVLPLLPLMYLFARYCNYSYSSRVEHPPLWLAHDAPRTEIDPLVYTPPCLQPHAQGWYFEMGKAWVRWGSPAYLDPTI